MTMPPPHLALTLPLRGSRLIEASAGTGKTFTISALYVRLVLGHGGADGFGRELLPPDILVMTFTEAATQELRDRIRTRLTEAARFFRGETEAPDPLIERLRADYEEAGWPGCANRLDIAAQWMDEAAVSTIHGWCQRMLREHAFDSGSLFTQTVETDHVELLAQVVRDYWRQHCYALDGAALHWVDAHWGTPDALRVQLAGLLPHAPREPEAEPLQAVLDGATRELAASLAAIKAPWREWVGELRAAFDEACARKQVDGRAFKPAWYGPWLDSLASWASDAVLVYPGLSKRALERLTPEGIAAAWKTGEPLAHPALDAMRELTARLDALPRLEPRMLRHAAAWVRARLDDEKRQRAELGFDDMLERLSDALDGANGPQLAAKLRAQFPVALVDEFQDTDPVQYRIFDAVYDVAADRQDVALLMIGDPKQAIYAFRGADIYTYLAARRATGGRHHSLDTNHRSSTALVAAVNRLFERAERRPHGQGAFMFRRGDADPVPFHPVHARGTREHFVADGAPATPMTFWSLDAAAPVGAAAYQSAMAAGFASRIVDLLSQGAQGRAGFEQGGEMRPVQPADIAVLVRTGAEAQAIRSALARRGVRSVYLSDKDSVFRTPEALDLLSWLKACADPDDDRTLRAALASRTFGLGLAELERLNQDERAWESRILQFREYRLAWRRQGVLAMLRRMLNDFDLPRRLVARGDGERALTNLLHLAELLQHAAVQLDGEQALVRHLAEHVGGAPGTVSAEEQILRLESDEHLLKVVTIHKSKGLEYPLVFLPFICAHRPARKDRPPLRYHDDEGRLVISTAPDEREAEWADRERLAEDLRMLYVALTRARHACWLGLADLGTGRGSESILHRSAIGYLLGGGEPVPRPDGLAAWLGELCEGSDALRAAHLPEANERVLAPAAADTSALRLRTSRQAVGEPWSIASYSALRIGSPIPEEEGASDAARRAALLHDDTSPETAEAQKLLDDDVAAPPGERLAAASSGGLHRFPRGPKPGTFLHGLLEWAGMEGFGAALRQRPALADMIARRCNRRGWPAWIEPLRDWLETFLDQPFKLGGKAPPLQLSALRAYQVEMEFWFESRHVDVERLDALVRRHTLDGAPRPPAERATLNGMFKGFVDLVFEHDGRYYVADYKSNWLGPDDAAYTEAAMREAILSKRYDLQYVLYLLALHRQLRLRLGDGYDYDRHIGGSLYFFLRGGTAPTQGLFAERPSRRLIEALDDMFSGIASDAEEAP